MKIVRLVAKMQRWMDSKNGQLFMNYAYSWGASVVILGALFKLTHMSGADLMLFLGMGTEVIVFFISGFERQFEEVATAPAQATGLVNASSAPVDAGELADKIAASVVNITTSQTSVQSQQGVDLQIPEVVGMNDEMKEATDKYVSQLQELTSTLKAVAEQSARLTRDSEEMETMNRTLTGINRFYEMQLRSVSNQSNTIDEVNTQIRTLADKMEELNMVYSKMVEAMKAHVSFNA